MADTEKAQPDEGSTDDSMLRFDAWWDSVIKYTEDVARDLKDHPNPAEYCQQMDALIAAKEEVQ